MDEVGLWRRGLAPLERPARSGTHDTPRTVALRQHGRDPGPWEERFDRLRPEVREALVRVRRTLRSFPERFTRGTCGVGSRGGTWVCDRPAGWRTEHEGEGACLRHGGMRSRRAEVAWVTAHRFAEELECSPWDGLLRAVRIAAGKVAYTQWVLSQARSDLELEGRRPREVQERRELASESGETRVEWVGTGLFVHPDTGEPLGADEVHARNLQWWVEKNELWTDRLARYSKAAVDAGVAERLVQQVELQAEALARPLQAALTALDETPGLAPEVRELLTQRMREAIRGELLALDAEGTVIRGELVPWPERESLA